MGLMVIGAMIPSMVTLTLGATVDINGAQVVLQEIIDQICPFILPLGLVGGCYSLLKKGKSGTAVMFGLLVLGIVLVLASILIMNTDFSKLRNSVFVGHVIESMTFKPNAWWTEKSQDMDLFRERTGITLEPTVQESPWYFVR